MKKLNYTRISLHIIFWLVYIPINAVLNCILNRLPVMEALPDALIGELFSLPVKILLVYFIFYFVIPLYLDRKQVWKMIGLLAAAFTVSAALYRLALTFIIIPIARPGLKFDFWNLPGITVTFFDLFITVTAATFIKMIRVHYASRDFEQQLIREKLQSELNFLRAQTNPHFLFNTLNNIYVLAWKKSDKTAASIMKLSQIMRFVLYECRAHLIEISKEAKVVQDYIELEKLRYNDRLKVNYSENLDDPEAMIAPLLLLPFVENSFKHGPVSTTGNAEISVDLQLRENHLSFTVENTVEEGPDKNGNGSGEGIGLKNVKRQLELIYPGNHTLEISPGSEIFKIKLEVNLS